MGTQTPQFCPARRSRPSPHSCGTASAGSSPVHIGDICLQGTACNAATNPQEGDRRLGDYFTVNFTHDGSIYMVSGDTRLPNPIDGGPKVLSNPIFIKQTRGTKLLTTQIPNRPTRPLCAPPDCVD